MKAARKIVVIGRIEEPVGKERDRYRELGARLAPVADLIFCIGDDELKSLRAAALKAGRNPAAIQFLGSRIAGVAEQLQAVLQPGDLVLFKGASHQRLRRIVLQIVGKNVACGVKYCAVKVVACDACPLLAAPETAFKNYFISRYIKF